MDLSQQLAKALFGNDEPKKTPKRRPRNAPSHWARVVLLERAAYLKEMARFGSGEASETVREFPGHAARLVFRSRSGEAEIDEKCALVYFVITGTATLATGGKLKNGKALGAGLMRGDALEDGVTQQLRSGDVVHVPAGVPHQMLLAGSETISCFALRIEMPEEKK